MNTAVEVRDQTSPIISGNTVGGEGTAISIPSSTTGAVLSGNTIGMWTDGLTADAVRFGITVSGPNATVGPDNAIGYATDAGVLLSGANPRVISNRIGVPRFGAAIAAGNQTGIRVAPGATGAVIGGTGSGNTIANNGVGIDLEEVGADVSRNTMGIVTSGAAGNSIGITANKDASIHDNTIANSAHVGIGVGTGAVVKILHNSIYGSGDLKGIDSTLSAGDTQGAARVVHGTSARTWLILTNVPTAAGTIEVFGNASCSDPEGRYPLFTTPTTAQSLRVLSIADRTDLNGLTITVTTAAGTSHFSACATPEAAADTDGDGIPDVVEAASPVAPEAFDLPNVANFVGDNQQWVSVSTSSGALQNVSPIDDPDPSGHPGATFPLGLIDWTVTGLAPGATAKVAFTLPGTIINGWWKYNAHQSPQYFDFPYSSTAGYGAAVANANLPIFGLSTNVVLFVKDGGVGDDDGSVNGSVTDPSAPAVIAAAPAAPVVVTPAASTASGTLAATGVSDPLPGAAGGIVLLLSGAALLLMRRIRRRAS